MPATLNAELPKQLRGAGRSLQLITGPLLLG